MRFFLAALPGAIWAIGASAQFAPEVRYVTAGAQEARALPSEGAPIVAALPGGRNVYVREIFGEWVRIDASDVAGNAYLPLGGVRAAPVPARAGRCDCPGDVRADGHLCGRASAFCRPGGPRIRCHDPRLRPDVCKAQSGS